MYASTQALLTSLFLVGLSTLAAGAEANSSPNPGDDAFLVPSKFHFAHNATAAIPALLVRRGGGSLKTLLSRSSTSCTISSDHLCSNGGCCPTGEVCCGTDYCCGDGYECCDNTGLGTCSPTDGDCCSDGSYCDSGYTCVLRSGEIKCAPTSGSGSGSGSGTGTGTGTGTGSGSGSGFTTSSPIETDFPGSGSGQETTDTAFFPTGGAATATTAGSSSQATSGSSFFPKGGSSSGSSGSGSGSGAGAGAGAGNGNPVTGPIRPNAAATLHAPGIQARIFAVVMGAAAGYVVCLL